MDLLRGVNAGPWSAFLKYDESPEAFAAPEAQKLRSLGFDHVRLPFREVHFWDESNREIPEAIDAYGMMLDICERAGLNVMMDFAVTRSHHYNDKDAPLFSDPACQDRFIFMWDELSKRFASRSNDFLAYELLNEPMAEAHKWNELVARVISVIRKREPNRQIVIGSTRWGSASTVAGMEVPDDKNLILSFHHYKPYILTHHKLCLNGWDGSIHYPGVTIREPELSTLSLKAREGFAPENIDWTRESHVDIFQSAVEKAKTLGLPLHCGEFGCCNHVPREARLRWYADVTSALETCGIGWCAFKHNGLWQTAFDGRDVDMEMVKALGVSK